MRRIKIIFAFLLPASISIHASYANDATVNYAATAISSIFQSTHRTQTMRQEIDTKRSRVSKFQSTHRTQTMRRRGWLSLYTSSEFQSTHRTQTMRPASELQAAILATFQSTHRTQTMRRNWRDDRPDGQDFNPRIVRKRCDVIAMAT